jgi:hypothetical protein
VSEPTDKDLPDEQQLDEYLRGGSAVSRQYRQLRSADVPTELDRLVLRQAEDAVKTRPAKSHAWRRWSGPLALAASAVLVISIVMESGVRDEVRLSVPASAPVETQAAFKRPAQTVDETSDQPSEQKTAESSAADAAGAAVVPIVPVEPTELALPKVAAPAPFAPQFTDDPPPAPPAVAAPKLERVPSADLRRGESEQSISQSAAVDPAPATMPAPAPVPAAEAPERDDSEVAVTSARARSLGDEEANRGVTGSMRFEHRRVARPRSTVAAPGETLSSAAEQTDEPRSYTDPEQWLRDIRELRKEKKHEEADREWLRFRLVFPNYAVAEDDLVRGTVR